MKNLYSVAASALNFAKPATSDLGDEELRRIEDAMRQCIARRGGDVATGARAAGLIARYATLDEAGRARFIDLAAGFGNDRAHVDTLLADVASAPDDESRARAERALRGTLVPKRAALLRAFNTAPEGVKFLVELRAALLHGTAPKPARKELEADLKELLASWFDVGFLELRRITWDAPASLLERLARYEAVHEIRGWADLKNRLDNDRRCFAIFHPAMPDEPLIFVEVALTDRLTGEMPSLLDSVAPVEDPALATHAIFYSISNCQRGLEGISFGNALLKRVVQALADEFRGLRTFATLSPLPNFRRWVESRSPAEKPDESALRAVFYERRWARDDQLAGSLRGPLTELCAHYLLEAKRPSGKALDPVAHFHLSNGARLERINWLADTSAARMRESAGMMVNYVYRLDRIDELAQGYADHSRISASAAVTALLSQATARPGDAAPVIPGARSS
jgi:malonyl-CoA decarboxylase